LAGHADLEEEWNRSVGDVDWGKEVSEVVVKREA
jgi:hypothetical protein